MAKKKSGPSPETVRQKKARADVIAAGGRQLQVLLDADEARAFEAAERVYGGVKAAIVGMARKEADRSNALTDAELVAQIKARLGVG